MNKKFTLITNNSGTKFDVLITAVENTYENNKLVRGNILLLSHEEVHELQDKVKLSKYESLYENSPDMYRTVNVKGIIVDCNSALQKTRIYEVGSDRQELDKPHIQ